MSDDAALRLFEPWHLWTLSAWGQNHMLFVHMYLFALIAPFIQGDDSKIMPLVLLSFYLQKQLFYLTYNQKPAIISVDENKIYS